MRKKTSTVLAATAVFVVVAAATCLAVFVIPGAQKREVLRACEGADRIVVNLNVQRAIALDADHTSRLPAFEIAKTPI